MHCKHQTNNYASPYRRPGHPSSHRSDHPRPVVPATPHPVVPAEAKRRAGTSFYSHTNRRHHAIPDIADALPGRRLARPRPDHPHPVVPATPHPVVSATPHPVVSATPHPVVSATPHPVVSATPHPVVSATPHPVVPAEAKRRAGTSRYLRAKPIRTSCTTRMRPRFYAGKNVDPSPVAPAGRRRFNEAPLLRGEKRAMKHSTRTNKVRSREHSEPRSNLIR